MSNTLGATNNLRGFNNTFGNNYNPALLGNGMMMQPSNGMMNMGGNMGALNGNMGLMGGNHGDLMGGNLNNQHNLQVSWKVIRIFFFYV